MEILLLICAFVAIFVVWRNGESSIERMREEMQSLGREVGWLRDQLVSMQRVQAESRAAVRESEAAAAASARVEAAPANERPAQQSARHEVAPATAAFTAASMPVATGPVAPEVVKPVPTQAPATATAAANIPSTAPAPLPQPWTEVLAKLSHQEATHTAPAPPPMPTIPQPQRPMPPAAELPRTSVVQEAPGAEQPVTVGAGSADETEARTAARTRMFSLEERLGTNWLNKLGVACVVLGLAYFLKYEFPTMSALGRVLTGFAVSALLLLGGVWLERKATYRIFARAGIGGGWALAYFTTFAMHHIQAAHVINSLAVDLLLMLLVAAGMVGHSLRYKSQTVTGLAFLLGFLTLLTSDLEAGDGTVVFSLTASAVLALALVIVTTLRHWTVLEMAGAAAVYLNHLVWLTQVLPADHSNFAQFWPSTILILLYWAIFRAAYVLRRPLSESEENQSALTAILNSGGVLGLLKFQSAHPEWAFWALAALGALEMALAFGVRSRRHKAFGVLSTIASVLLVASVPFKFHGVSWPVLWLIEAQALAVCGLRMGEPVFRRLGLLAGVLTGAVLAVHDVLPLLVLRLNQPDPEWVWGGHWSLTLALLLAATLFWMHAEVYPRRWPQIAQDPREAFALKITSWLGLGAAAMAIWVAVPEVWWPVGWLMLVLTLGFAGRRFKATLPQIEADLLALATGAVLASDHLWPLLAFRLSNADAGRHWTETAVFALAAASYWVHAEVFPRAFGPRVLPAREDGRAPEFDLGGWQGAVLPAISWLGVGSAAAALWVVLPALWLPVGWLALVLLMLLAAHSFGASVPALEADCLALGAAVVLALQGALPLVLFRLDNPDPKHHPALATVLGLAALAWWIRGEVFPRILPTLSRNEHTDDDLTSHRTFPPTVASWLGTAAAAGALWVVLPLPWVVVGWLGLMILLGLAADWAKAGTLGLQCDFLTVAAVLGLFPWTFWTSGWWDHKAPLIAAVALLYAGMRRRTVLVGSRNYVSAAYSWAATLLLAYVAALLCTDLNLVPVWAALALALFEIGRFSKKGFLRWQGFLLGGLAFANFFAFDLWNGGPVAPISLPMKQYSGSFSPVNSFLLEVLILSALGFLLMERTRSRERTSAIEHRVGLTGDALGTLGIALWFAYKFPSDWVPVPGGEQWVTAIWAGMGTVLLALAWAMRRRAFLGQALALAVAAAARGLIVDLFANETPGFWHGTLFHLGITALILLAALPFAFLLRNDGRFTDPTISIPGKFLRLLRWPEQVFFFAAFGLEAVALAAKLSSGHITIAWSLLGLATFLFALVVGERSFRLAGLGLLLVSVGKILVMDVWRLELVDRLTTLIVLGVALIAVSYLYTRFSSVIRKYL